MKTRTRPWFQMGYISRHRFPLSLTPKAMVSAKSRSSAPVLPLSLQRSFSFTRHFFSTKLYTSSPIINFDLAIFVTPKRNPQDRFLVCSVPPMAWQRASIMSGSARKMCLCSPNTHRGAFRCKLHRDFPLLSSSSSASSNSQLHMRRSTVKNSLVRVGSMEGVNEEIPVCTPPALISSSTKQNGVPPAAQQAPPYDHGGSRNRILRARL